MVIKLNLIRTYLLQTLTWTGVKLKSLSHLVRAFVFHCRYSNVFYYGVVCNEYTIPVPYNLSKIPKLPSSDTSDPKDFWHGLRASSSLIFLITPTSGQLWNLPTHGSQRTEWGASKSPNPALKTSGLILWPVCSTCNPLLDNKKPLCRQINNFCCHTTFRLAMPRGSLTPCLNIPTWRFCQLV